MVLRSIIRIDEGKCNGCGLCILACAEGALKIVNGKAKLIGDKYCDGLGACIGECPQGAITIDEREAEDFDEEAVKERLREKHVVTTVHHPHPIHPTHQPCPSAQVRHFGRNSKRKAALEKTEESMLSHWPVQLRLLPPNAPFFENANLLVVADCVPFAYAAFHSDFLSGRTLIVGCPKLDDAEFYKKKLTEIFRQNNIRSVTVVNMEVPCCFGLYSLVKEALASSEKKIPVIQETISIKGEKILSLHKHRGSSAER